MVGGQGVNLLENRKAIGFLSNTSSDPLQNRKALKPAFNMRPSSARQRNTIQTNKVGRCEYGLLKYAIRT